MTQDASFFPWINQGHKIFRGILIVQWIATIGIGIATGEVLYATLLGLFIVSLPLFLSFNQPHSTISQHAIAIAVQLMTVLHIHQSYGLVEVHFEIFTTLAILAIFRNWKVIVSATAVVAVHHVGFYILQVNDVGVFIFSPNLINFGILALHAFFALSEGIILMFMAFNAHKEGVGAIMLSSAVRQIVSDQDKLDLTVKLDTQYPILQPVEVLVEKLKSLIRITNENAQNVSKASTEILAASRNLSTSVADRDLQVSSITESLKSISEKLDETSELTKTADSVSEETKNRSLNTFDSVGKSKDIIGSLRATLISAANNSKELSQWSASIANAMNAITSISDQTNLLALNAAIESARAGEHGRGFAVVADEVRNLAIKSKTSAEEISGVVEKLVENSNSSLNSMQYCVETVDGAVNISEAATAEMQAIIQSISVVADNINKVALSAEQQNITSNLISDKTSDVQRGTKDEVAISERLNDQVSTLTTLSEKMLAATKRFKID